MVAIEGAGLARPAVGDAEIALGDTVQRAWPSPSTISGLTPKKGRVAEPGLVAMAPGSGVIMMPPVSVCHQVSTIGNIPSPTTLWYHSQASGLIGSPTEPSTRRLARLVAFDRPVAVAHQGAERVGAV